MTRKTKRVAAPGSKRYKALELQLDKHLASLRGSSGIDIMAELRAFTR